VCKKIHAIQESMARGEAIDNETLITIVSDSVLELIEGKRMFQLDLDEAEKSTVTS